MKNLAEKVSSRLKELGLSQSEAARMTGVSPQSIQAIVKGVTLAPKYPDRLAKALNVTTDWLMGDDFTDLKPVDIVKTTPPKPAQATSTDQLRIPIRGFAQANYIDVGNAVKKPIGFLNLAPQFANIVDLYAVYVTGDSMNPAHEHGDIRLVSPHTPAKIGDTVVIVKSSKNGEPETSYIKTYTSKIKVSDTRTMLHFGQHHPDAELIFDETSIIQMHKVLTYNEILGL